MFLINENKIFKLFKYLNFSKNIPFIWKLTVKALRLSRNFVKMIKKVWNMASAFDESTNFFVHSLTMFKFLGFSIMPESGIYNWFRVVSMLSIGLLWIFVGWDIFNNITNFRELSENISTGAVHLMGLIRFSHLVRFRYEFNNRLKTICFVPDEQPTRLYRNNGFYQLKETTRHRVSF